ncbi:tetratricopeptide repeat protein [Candidatus Electrothrix sp.]|uniref:tetratricopeptide repeat protein n=1 Tax=Candidatus Electrothrix sp. TaxID=2170559 RepID=UPI004055B382
MLTNKDYYDKVYSLIRQKKYDEALAEILDQGTETLIPPYDEDLNHGWYLVADIYYKKKDYQKAISFLIKSLDDREDDTEAMHAISDCYFKINRPDIAEKYLQSAIAIEPKQIYVYNLANSLYDQGMFSEALKLYKTITNEDSELHRMAQKNSILAKERIGK